MIFFPVGQDSELRRWPVITTALILVMFLVHGYNEFTSRTQERRYRIAEIRYETVFQDITREYIHAHRSDELFTSPEMLDSVLEITTDQDEKVLAELESGELIARDSRLYREFEAARDALEAARNSFLYLRFGFIPSHPTLLTMVTSIFLHADLVHFVFNMVFLWFAGINLEDRWGRIPYLCFFVLGGVAACYAHMLHNPHSDQPTIGASGAVAALMGGMAVRFPRIPTRIFWLWFGFTFRFGVVTIPAYVGLAVWFMTQLFLSALNLGNVAYMAHIGGFAAGMAGAMVLMISGLDRRLDAMSESRADAEQFHAVIDANPLLQKALKHQAAGRTDRAVRLMKHALEKYPDDPLTREHLGMTYLQTGQFRLAALQLTPLVESEIERGDLESARALMDRVRETAALPYFPAPFLVTYSDLLMRQNTDLDLARACLDAVVTRPGPEMTVSLARSMLDQLPDPA